MLDLIDIMKTTLNFKVVRTEIDEDLRGKIINWVNDYEK